MKMKNRKVNCIILILVLVTWNAIASVPETETCDPDCESTGICVDGSCFCSYPYTGDSCGDSN